MVILMIAAQYFIKYVYVFFLALCKDSKIFFSRMGNIDVSDFNPCHDQRYYPSIFTKIYRFETFTSP